MRHPPAPDPDAPPDAPPARIVAPLPERLKDRLRGQIVPSVIAALLPWLARTWRIELPPWPVEGPCVVGFWHGDQLPLVALHRHLGLTGLASRSRDGEIVAQTLQRLGYPVLRGSSSRGGAEALRAALSVIRAGGRPALALDGPRGPRHVPQPGAAALARMGRVKLVQVEIQGAGLRLPTWDRFFLPWPFARLQVTYRTTAHDRGIKPDPAPPGAAPA